MLHGLTLDDESGCRREEAARPASGRRADPDGIGIASVSLRPTSGGIRDDSALECDFLGDHMVDGKPA